MKYAFFGTTEFSAQVLRPLLRSSLSPALVVCNPDRPAGRKKILTPPPSKLLAQEAGIPVLQPEIINESFIEKIQAGEFDFGVLASYGKILPTALLNAFKQGVIGVHVSLLPKYRGASPMQTVILNGEAVTGVTLYLMDEKVDHGPILAKAEFSVGNKNFAELQIESARHAAELLNETLPEFFSGNITPLPQDESEATFTRKFKTEDGFVENADLEAAERGDHDKALKIDRMIRALLVEPGVWTIRNGKRLKLLGSRLEGNSLRLTRIQWEGKTPEDIV